MFSVLFVNAAFGFADFPCGHVKMSFELFQTTIAVDPVLSVTSASSVVKPEAQSMGEFVAANVAFALDVYRQISAMTPGDNIFVSPLSISAALAKSSLTTSSAPARDSTGQRQCCPTSLVTPRDLVSLSKNGWRNKRRRRLQTFCRPVPSTASQPWFSWTPFIQGRLGDQVRLPLYSRLTVHC